MDCEQGNRSQNEGPVCEKVFCEGWIVMKNTWYLLPVLILSIMLSCGGGGSFVDLSPITKDVPDATIAADSETYEPDVQDTQDHTDVQGDFNESETEDGWQDIQGTLPAAPTGLAAVGGNLDVSLDWNLSDDATSYTVLRGSAAGGPYAEVGSTTTAYFLDVSLAPGRTYFYVVRAKNAAGTSGNSNEASATTNTCPLPSANPRMVPNGPVNAITQIGCTIYIGGQFDAVGPIAAHGASISPSTGLITSGFVPLLIDGEVQAVAADSANGWYIGGAFTKIGESNRYGLAHINSDGSLDATWNPNTTSDSINPGYRINAIATSGNNVFVAGNFTKIAGATRNGVVALNAANVADPGMIVSTWNSNTSGSVSDLAVSGTRLYMAGSFTAGERSYLAAIDTSTGATLDWNPGTVHYEVVTVAVSPDGQTIYAGGGVPTNCTSRSGLGYLKGFDATTGAVTWAPYYGWAWGTGSSCYGGAVAMEMNGSTLYVAGGYHSWKNGADYYNGGIVTYVPDSENPGHLSANTSSTYYMDKDTLALAISGTTVYASGNFTTVTTYQDVTPTTWARKGLVAIGADGEVLDWNSHTDGSATTIAAGNSAIYAGGSFNSIGGTPRNHLAAIGTDGSLKNWDPGADNVVRALVASGSTVYAGGDFILVGGTQRNYLAAIGIDGSLQDWNPNVNDSVYALAAGSSTIYVGGKFTSIMMGGDTTSTAMRSSLAAVGIDGTLRSWNPSADQTVRALAATESAIYAAGEFTIVNGMQRNYLAALDMGGSPLGWNPNADATAFSLAIGGSTVYTGGGFEHLSSVSRLCLAAIGTDAILKSWNPAADAKVYGLAVNLDGTVVYSGGDFTKITIGSVSTPRDRAAAIGSDGTLQTWNPGANGTVDVLFMGLDGLTVYAGGSFTTIGNSINPFFAPLDPTTGLLE